MLRYLAQHEAELVACDIHPSTIEWLTGAYPTVRVYISDELPALPEADESFDLICCVSVFSHLPDWAPWLLEMRRLLRPGGLLFASIHGRGFWRDGVAGARGVPWDEDNTGIIVERLGEDFERGWGPAVFVSEWWLREHWGRALHIERFEPSGFAMSGNRESGQAWLLARKTDDHPLSSEALTEPSNDPRELPSAVRAQWLAYAETASHLADVRRLRAAAQGRLERDRPATTSRADDLRRFQERLTGESRAFGRLMRDAVARRR